MAKRLGLDGAGALEAPAVVGDRLGEVALVVADGGQGFEGDFGMRVVGLLLVRGVDVELAGESVTIGVEGADFFAFGVLGPVEWLGRGASIDCGSVMEFSLCKMKMARCRWLTGSHWKGVLLLNVKRLFSISL